MESVNKLWSEPVTKPTYGLLSGSVDDSQNDVDDVSVGQPEVMGELLEKSGQGDRAAFDRLYRLTVSRVYALTRRVLVDPDLADDATQETYLQVWQSASNYSSDLGSPLAWLMTIAHRRAVDRVRSVQKASDRELRYGQSNREPDHDSVAETVATSLESEAVVLCLDRLSPIQHESITLAYYSGLTYREVAERLRTAVPTIKSRIRDGLLRLQKCLEVSWDER